MVTLRNSFLRGFEPDKKEHAINDSLIHFFIRKSNFGAEAERSYILLRFEAENLLKMFVNYMVYTTCISVNQ